MTSYNGNMIYYDGMTTLGSFKVGNPTTYNNGTAWTFTWEHGRQLATMTSGSTTWTNTYNSDGLRTSRSDGTTTYTYIYEDGRLSAIKRNDLNMWIIYDDNGPVTLKYGSGTFHYVTNPQGDVVAIVGNQGQKLVEYTYDAWGKVTSITGDYAYNLGIHNPILYRGYIYDHETGMYYCQSRYYDPETGRFLNADAFASTGQGLIGNNMFAYCQNNPVMFVDPSGFTIVLASDATEEQIAEYESAVAYLKRSKTGEELIEMLEASPTMFVIVFIDDNNMRFDPNSNTIYFDTNSGLILVDGISVQSAALGLAHEMGHAAQKLAGFFRNKNTREIEELNLQMYETPIAGELGEPTRSNYFDASGFMDMQNSIHYITTYKRPWWHYIGFWNWGKPSAVAVDHNLTK